MGNGLNTTTKRGRLSFELSDGASILQRDTTFQCFDSIIILFSYRYLIKDSSSAWVSGGLKQNDRRGVSFFQNNAFQPPVKGKITLECKYPFPSVLQSR